MTVKALKKQLMAAIAMVVVSAIALSSSTYAWFVSSKEVTAEAMQVTANTEGGILIGSYTGTEEEPVAPVNAAFGSAKPTAITASSTLAPTSTDTEMNKWYATHSNAVDKVKYDGITYNVVDNTKYGDYRDYNKFKLKTVSGTEDVYIKSIDIAGADNSTVFNTALRVLIKVNSDLYFFAPNYSNDADVTQLSYVKSTEASENYTVGQIYTGKNVPSDKIIAGLTDVGEDVEIFIYYEGEDAGCTTNIAQYNNNAGVGTKITVDTLTVSVTFTTEAP